MPAGRLISIAIRRTAIRTVAHQSLAARGWFPCPRVLHCSQQKSRYANFVPSNARKDDQEPQDELDGDGPGSAEARREHELTVDTLYQRLRHPRRKKGHDGINIRLVPGKPQKEGRTGVDGSAVVSARSKGQKLPWWKADTGVVERKLSTYAHNAPSVRKIQPMLKTLISSRSVKPTTSHYETAVLANCDPQLGSVKIMESVLEEMERENISIGLSVYVAALKVSCYRPGSSQFHCADYLRS